MNLSTHIPIKIQGLQKQKSKTNQQHHRLPESNVFIVRHVGEERLIDIEHPRISSVSDQSHAPRERQRQIPDHFAVPPVPLSGNVLSHEIHAIRRHALPRPRIVRLHRQPPAVAVIARDRLLRRQPEDRLRKNVAER